MFCFVLHQNGHDQQTSLAPCWLYRGPEVVQPASRFWVTGHKPLGRLTSPLLTSVSWPLLLFPHCLLFLDRDEADCVESNRLCSADSPGGAAHNDTFVCTNRLPVTTNAMKSREGEKLRGGGCLGEDQWRDVHSGEADAVALINMVMSSAMTSHRKAQGQWHRKCNLIETH